MEIKQEEAAQLLAGRTVPASPDQATSSHARARQEQQRLGALLPRSFVHTALPSRSAGSTSTTVPAVATLTVPAVKGSDRWTTRDVVRHYGYRMSKIARVRQFHGYLCDEVLVRPHAAGTGPATLPAFVPFDIWAVLARMPLCLVLAVVCITELDPALDAVLASSTAATALTSPLEQQDAAALQAILPHLGRQLHAVQNLIDCCMRLNLISASPTDDGMADELTLPALTAVARDIRAQLQSRASAGIGPERLWLARCIRLVGFASDTPTIVAASPSTTDVMDSDQLFDLCDTRSSWLMWGPILARRPAFLSVGSALCSPSPTSRDAAAMEAHHAGQAFFGIPLASRAGLFTGPAVRRPRANQAGSRLGR